MKLVKNDVNFNEIVFSFYPSLIIDYDGIKKYFSSKGSFFKKNITGNLSDSEYGEYYNIVLKNSLHDYISLYYEIDQMKNDFEYKGYMNYKNICSDYNSMIEIYEPNVPKIVKYSGFVNYFKKLGYDVWTNHYVENSKSTMYYETGLIDIDGSPLVISRDENKPECYELSGNYEDLVDEFVHNNIGAEIQISCSFDKSKSKRVLKRK